MIQRTSNLRPALLLLIAILGVSTIVTSAQAAEEVTVKLQSGRSFTGMVDHQSNDEKLYLRFEGAATTMWRPIAWGRVIEARYQDQKLGSAEFKQLALRIKSKRSAIKPAPTQSLRSERTMAQQAHQALAGSPTVRSVAIDATAANWDSDVELDGLLVRVYPLDGYGQVVPAQGSLNVELIGSRPAAAGTRHVYHRGQPFEQIGRWTRQVHDNSETSQGTVFRLPFQAMHPEFRLDLAAHGVVHARLVVPGHGVFETSVNLVRLRPFSPTRDHLQHHTGQRFFASEQLGRTH